MNIASFVMFVGTTLALLVGFGYAVAFTASRAFSWSAGRFALFSVIVVLHIGFILSMMAVHYVDNAVARFAYLLSGVWLGLFVNLILAAVLYWVIVWLARVGHLPLSTPTLGWALLLLAGVLTIGGVWKAFSPQVREVRVALAGLPDEWKGRRIVQLSDVHLGSLYRAPFLRGVVERVNALQPDLVVITGDLFDGVDGNLAGIALPLRDLAARQGVYFVTGNHETYLGIERSFAALEQTGVRILRDEVVDIGGVKLVGFDYPERNEEKDIITTLDRLSPQYAGYPTILLAHAPKRIPDVAARGIHLQLSGHTHKGQQFPFGFVTRLVHKGFDYGLYTIGDFHLYTSSGVGTWGPPLRVGTRSEIVLITLE